MENSASIYLHKHSQRENDDIGNVASHSFIHSRAHIKYTFAIYG